MWISNTCTSLGPGFDENSIDFFKLSYSLVVWDILLVVIQLSENGREVVLLGPVTYFWHVLFSPIG